MVRVKIIDDEDILSMLQSIRQISYWLHDLCISEKFCQHKNDLCNECNISSLCEESDELVSWAVSSQEKYKDLLSVN